MQVTITAVGPDNRGLADPIVHFVTSLGANIYEIQMYDHDQERLFAMLVRIELETSAEDLKELRLRFAEIEQQTGLSIRVWSRDESPVKPRIAICTTYRLEPAQAILDAINRGELDCEVAVVLGNRPAGKALADEAGVDWHLIGDPQGNPDNEKMVALFDQYQVDYIILARYMRVLPAGTCWRFAGGRIINLHHGLLPSFPGFRPYEDAFSHRMLTYGATVHFIIPELDAGNQILHQGTFTVSPGTSLEEIKRTGEAENEPRCLVKGLKRVVDREVELHFHRVVKRE
ncbi:MAG: formyltetrahydrofolate deformylase [Planctomycetaceae bacterium]|nr:formyltetrahydrofolate deformylase [Planctomycetaceae bacterium]